MTSTALRDRFQPTPASVPPAGTPNIRLQKPRGIPVNLQPLVRMSTSPFTPHSHGVPHIESTIIPAPSSTNLPSEAGNCPFGYRTPRVLYLFSLVRLVVRNAYSLRFLLSISQCSARTEPRLCAHPSRYTAGRQSGSHRTKQVSPLLYTCISIY